MKNNQLFSATATNVLPTIIVPALLFCCAPVFAQQIIFSDDFESGTTFKSQWTPRPGANKGLVAIATTLGNTYIPCNGNQGVGMGLSGDLSGTTTYNYLDLSLNLAGKTNVTLSFWLKDADNGYTENGILFSNDGGMTFPESTFFQFKPDEYADDVCGQFPPIDIAKASGLALNGTFVIRFRSKHFKDFNSAGGRDGLMIDDVVVRESPAQYAPIPFTDDFETPSLKNNWSWVDPYRCGGTVSDPGQIRPDGVVAPLSSFAGVSFPPYSGNQVLAMGQRQDPAANTLYVANAIDLHLNLLNRPQAELRFALQDWGAYYNSNNPAEIGLFFSNNGGLSFKKVYDFPFNKWTDDVWGELMIDIDKLAAANGLYPLSDKFVIRFQERFNRDFNFAGGRQAVLIDNVRVTAPDIKYAGVPFCDGFEAGLPDHWYRADAFVNGMTISNPSWIRPDALLDVLSSYAGINFPAHEGAKVLVMGMRQDPTDNSYYAVNAADLRVNMQGVNGAKLNFWMRDYNDSNQDEDGVYFSNNGGETFKQVYTFNPAGTDDVWKKYTLDLDALCAQVGLPKSATFVIRFQQRGNRDFSTAGGSQGFIIDEVSVCVPPASINVTGMNTSCGQSNGSASAPEGYTAYLWSNGKTTKEISGLAAGLTGTTYTVTVTTSEGCGCTASGSVTIGGSCSPPGITTVVTNNASCAQPNGKISLFTTSLCSPLTYIWNNGYTDKDLTGLPAGAYTVTVTDGKGCSSSTSTVVGPPTVATLSSSVTHTTCGLANGKITVTAQGGTAVSSWKWEGGNANNATTPTISGLTSGMYTVTMTDVNTCTRVASGTVNSSQAAPSPGLGADTTLQQGQSTIYLCAKDLSNATYKWAHGPTTRCITVPAGTYTVTVTVDGCTSSDDIIVKMASSAHDLTGIYNIILSPNPTERYLRITLDARAQAEIRRLQIVGLNGQLLHSESVAGASPVLEVSLDNLPAGTYMLLLRSKTGIWSGTIIKK
ncbi:MAG: T9SS type A sorting domain-containing protein [Saprospiraceae bacterium]|nr:T9SS type A sorting domain-containing protein [Saprospiraceae bacterium]